MKSLVTIITLISLQLGFATSAFANLWAQPSMVDFYRVPVKSFGERRSVRLTNYGNERVNVDVSHSCYGDFRVYDNFCYRLDANQSCRIDIEFRPYYEGYQNCRITVTSDLGDYESISVRGQGIRN